MLDHKINTFLKLCELMNYRATAEALSMTQPAVTQHIKSLEQHYQCKLFVYQNKKLTKTSEARQLQKICQSAFYNETSFIRSIGQSPHVQMRLGATKTIGDYAIADNLSMLLDQDDVELSVYVDNTMNLLGMLSNAQIDFAIIEGEFDKHNYGHRLMREEAFVGVCPKDHPFAGRTVPIEDIFHETLLLREPGSGTRMIFQQFLEEHGYPFDCFRKVCDISSFELIKKLLIQNHAITFAYRTIADNDDRLAMFEVKGTKIIREFNFVYLKGSMAEQMVTEFCTRTGLM